MENKNRENQNKENHQGWKEEQEKIVMGKKVLVFGSFVVDLMNPASSGTGRNRKGKHV